MIRRIRSILAASLITIGVLFAQPGKQTLAILNFEAIGISNDKTRFITERLSTYLDELDVYLLLDGSQIEEILEGQSLTMTSHSHTEECSVEVGEVLNAQLVLDGSIGKTSGLYSINTRIIDVETGLIVKSVAYDYKGTFETLLSRGLRELAQKIANKLNVAILEFQVTGDLGISDAGKTVAEWMSNALHNTNQFVLYERVLLQKILEEQELGLSGALDESTATKIGKIYGVDAIATGTISKFGTTITVIAKLIDTQTARVITTAEYTTKAEDEIAGAINSLAMKLTK